MDAMIKVGKRARAIRTDYYGYAFYDWRIPITTDDGYLIGIYFKRDCTEICGKTWPENERWYFLNGIDTSDYDEEYLDVYHVSAVELACMWAEILASELTPEKENKIRERLYEVETVKVAK